MHINVKHLIACFLTTFVQLKYLELLFGKAISGEKGKVEKSSKIMKDSSLWPLDQVQKVPKCFETILMNAKVLGI